MSVSKKDTAATRSARRRRDSKTEGKVQVTNLGDVTKLFDMTFFALARGEMIDREAAVEELKVVSQRAKTHEVCDKCLVSWQKENLGSMPCKASLNGADFYSSSNLSVGGMMSMNDITDDKPFDLWINDMHYIITGPGMLVTSKRSIQLDGKEVAPHNQGYFPSPK